MKVHVITRSYSWEYEVVEEGADEAPFGIITVKDFQARTMAIVKGEYKPKAYEPKQWRAI